METDRVGASLFDVFFSRWVRAVVRERFEEATAGFVVGGANALSAALLQGDAVGWFAPGRRESAILGAMNAAMDWLAQRLGPDQGQWTWGRLHVLPMRHILSGRGDLGRLLDHGGLPVPGNAHTVCSTTSGPAFKARFGAGYRLVADLSTSPAGLWAVDVQSQSGHPGSPHYSDQFLIWIKGEYHPLPLSRDEVARLARSTLILEDRPCGESGSS
jgi:penicillin amidase